MQTKWACTDCVAGCTLEEGYKIGRGGGGDNGRGGNTMEEEATQWEGGTHQGIQCTGKGKKTKNCHLTGHGISAACQSNSFFFSLSSILF